jgi:hypothetical protein
MAPKDFWMYGRYRRLNHFTYKLTNSIQNLAIVLWIVSVDLLKDW